MKQTIEEKREKWRKENNKYKERKRLWRLKNKEKIRERDKKYRELHKEETKKWMENHKEERRQYLKQYEKTHPEELKRNRLKYYKTKGKEHIFNRLKCDNIFKIKHHLRNRLRQAIKENQKSGSAIRDLGCTIPQLKTYLKSKFQKGMSWENYGLYGWHIDHITPLSSFDLTNREEFLKACHYTNLQPLWAKENLIKGNN